MQKRVLSAIQPTGYMHLGNYFGALKNWVDLQDDYICTYGVVDYHAMTMPFDLKKLRNNTWEMIYNLIAIGVKPENLFVQSLVPEHAELCWILNCFCSYGELTRMTQFKDKSQQVESGTKDQFISAGLLDYPVLQVADILIYRADYVPIGKDQTQHLELTRNVAQRFNSIVGKEHFTLPEPLYTETPKILSTADPSRKMSKSAGEKHYISVFGDEAVIKKQIRSAVTDTGERPSDGSMSPGVENLFMLMKASGATELYEQSMTAYNDNNLKYSDLKQNVTDALLPMLQRFRENKNEVISDKKQIKSQIKYSSAEIRKRAQETLAEIKDLVGLLNVKF